jgi:hypothetical protein
MKFNANIFETNNSNPRICTISINLLSFTTVGQLPKCSLWEPAGRGLNHNTYKDPRSRVGLGKSQYKKLQLLINFLKESIWFQNTILSQENQMLQLFWCVGGRAVWRPGGGQTRRQLTWSGHRRRVASWCHQRGPGVAMAVRPPLWREVIFSSNVTGSSPARGKRSSQRKFKISTTNHL